MGEGLQKEVPLFIPPRRSPGPARQGLLSMACPRSGESKSISLVLATHRPCSPSLQTLRLGASSPGKRSVGRASLNQILWLLTLGLRSLDRFSRRALIERASDYVEVPFLTLLLHTLCAFCILHLAAAWSLYLRPKPPLQARLHASGLHLGRDPPTRWRGA